MVVCLGLCMLFYMDGTCGFVFLGRGKLFWYGCIMCVVACCLVPLHVVLIWIGTVWRCFIRPRFSWASKIFIGRHFWVYVCFIGDGFLLTIGLCVFIG